MQKNFKICFPDYALFEELDIMEILDSNSLNNFPHLKAYHQRMHDRPNIKVFDDMDFLVKVLKK